MSAPSLAVLAAKCFQAAEPDIRYLHSYNFRLVLAGLVLVPFYSSCINLLQFMLCILLAVEKDGTQKNIPQNGYKV